MFRAIVMAEDVAGIQPSTDQIVNKWALLLVLNDVSLYSWTQLNCFDSSGHSTNT